MKNKYQLQEEALEQVNGGEKLPDGHIITATPPTKQEDEQIIV